MPAQRHAHKPHAERAQRAERVGLMRLLGGISGRTHKLLGSERQTGSFLG